MAAPAIMKIICHVLLYPSETADEPFTKRVANKFLQ